MLRENAFIQFAEKAEKHINQLLSRLYSYNAVFLQCLSDFWQSEMRLLSQVLMFQIDKRH